MSPRGVPVVRGNLDVPGEKDWGKGTGRAIIRALSTLLRNEDA